MGKICSLITLFNPDLDKLQRNLNQILLYAEKVYLLCNSEIDHDFENERICLIDNKKNIGLSKAFNKGLCQAQKDGFEYAVLFDQDSILKKEEFQKLYEEYCNESKTKKVACIGPSLRVRGNTILIPYWTRNRRFQTSKNILSVNNIITSGMFLNIEFYMNMGGFDENFSVDFCDFTLCWNFLYKGYAVLQSQDAILYHEIGNSGIRIGKHTIHFHAPYRNYFLVRDTLNIIYKYRSTPLIVRLRFALLLPIKLILYFVKLDQKKMRLKVYYWGIMDFVHNVHGYGSVAKMLGADR